MASPYDAIVKKYAGTSTPTQPAPDPKTLPKVGGTGVFKNVPILPEGPMDKLPAPPPGFKPGQIYVEPAKLPAVKPQGLDDKNPYTAVVSKHLTDVKQKKFDEGTAATNKALQEGQNPGLGTQVLDIAKGLPGGLFDVGKEAITHPLKSGQSVLLGLMDVGPAIVNAIGGFSDSVYTKIHGKPPETPAFMLPLPGQTFHEFMGSGYSNDVQTSLSEGAKQYGSFELGGGAVKSTFGAATTFAGKVAQGAAGNVIGGQAILPPGTSLEDRAKAAAFDAAFGVASEAAGAGFRALRGKKVEAPAPEVAPAKPGETPVAPKPETPATVPPNAPKAGPPEPTLGNIVYKPKTNLGKDGAGEKILATTQYDSRTGRAIIYYDKALDAKPDLRATVLDHEEGHVLDKRINSGNNLSAELQNPKGNAGTLENVIGPFAKETGQTTEEAATKLATDIQTLSEGVGSSPAELFANAYAKYRADVAAARKAAPTFAAFMDHVPVPKGATKIIQERSVSEGQIRSRTTIVNGKTAREAAPKPLKGPVKLPPIKRVPPKPGEIPNNPFPKRKEYIPSKEVKRALMRATPAKTVVVEKPVKTTVKAGFKQKIVEKPAKVAPKTIIRAAPPKYEAKPTPGSGRIAGTGLRTGKGVNTKSFNPSKINAPDEVQSLFDTMGKENKNFASQRLSKGNEDIKDLARLTGLTEDELLAAKPGSIANAETTTAARQLVLDKAAKLMNTLKSIDVSTASPDQLKAIKEDFIKLVSMQKAVAGFRTEASNVFRSLGLELMPGENATLAELAALLKNEGIASADDAAVFANKVAKATSFSKLEKVREGVLSTWYSSILSGPKTTVRNVLSTGSNILTELAAKMVNPKQWKEVVPAVSGLIRGLKMGRAEAREVLSGAPTPTKFMETGGKAGRPEVFTGKWAAYGSVVESVGRFLNAQDRFLAAGAREMERASLAVHSSEVSKAVEDAITKAYAERTVYHGVPTGRIIGAIRSGAQTLRSKAPWTKFIIPFVDTVANVMDRQFDYIPLTAALRLRPGIISEQAARIVKEYGLKPSDTAFIEQRLYDQQLGRLFLGTAVSTGAIALAGAGRVSGVGPTNAAERQQLERTGWRPNSIKIGDVWLPYVYLGPLAGILSMAGNVHDKVVYDGAPGKSLTSLLANGLIGWTQTQLNQSFLSGVADIFDVATGNLKPETYITNFATGLIPIPAAYSQTKDMVFRQQYETHGIVEKLRQKLGLTGDVFGMKALEPRLDVFGNRMTADFIFGVSPSVEKFTPVDRFLTANDLAIALPSHSQQYSIPGAGKEKRSLTPEEYTKYIKDTGEQIYTELSRRLDELGSIDDPDRQKKIVDNLVDRIRTRVRTDILRGSK